MTQVTYPSMLTRIKSIFIDVVCMVLFMYLATVVLSLFGEPPVWTKVLTFILIWGVYEPLATCTGGTIGNRMMKIAVRNVNDPGRSINFLKAYIRFVIKSLLGTLSFITMNFNAKRRAIHDLAAGSVVVEK